MARIWMFSGKNSPKMPKSCKEDNKRRNSDIENQFLKNLEAFYIGKEKNIDIKKLKGSLQEPNS